MLTLCRTLLAQFCSYFFLSLSIRTKAYSASQTFCFGLCLRNSGNFLCHWNVSGMSVEIGKIVDNEKTYIAGAPRSRNTGQVLLFKPTSDAMTISPQHYLSGEQFGSGFGYDIAVSDFDSDGCVYKNIFLFLTVMYRIEYNVYR